MSGFLGYDPERLRRLDASVAHAAADAFGWRSFEALAEPTLARCRAAVDDLAELRPAIARVLRSDADAVRAARIGADDAIGVPGWWSVTVAAPATPGGGAPTGVDRALALVVELLTVLTTATTARWDDWQRELEAIEHDEAAARALVDALGPARVARLLDGLRATLALADVPAARAASTSLAHLLGTALSRPGTDLAPWRPVLAALAPATLARLLHDTPLPDALLVPLARQVLTDPGGDAPGSGDDAVPALDHAAAALARRPAAAALALTGLDADAWRRLLGTPTDGGVAALLRTLAARDALTPSVAAGIVDPLIDVLRDEPDRPPPPTRAALGDVLGAWVDHLTAATTGIGAFAPRPVEDLHAALAAAARSAEGAEALTAWLVAVTREGLAPGGAGPVTSPLVLGLAADVVGSAVVAGRRAWAERRAEQRDDLTSLAHDVLSVPVGKLATLVARHPAAAPAVSYVQRVTTDWVVDRAADLVGLPDADEPARTRRRAEADRERLALVLAVDALALGGASPALVAAARAARTRTELVAVLDRRRADVPPVVLEYLAGLAGCDRRVCR